MLTPPTSDFYIVNYTTRQPEEICVDSGRLAGRVAMVTGASRGIGAAIATRLARDGASVVVNYLTSEAAAASVVAHIVSTGGRAKAFKADVCDPGECKSLVEWAAETLGGVDIVVNNVGATAIAPLEAIDEAHVRSIVRQNINGPIFVTQAAVTHLSRSTSGGRVVNVSAIASHHSIPGVSVYAAAKAALNALTRTWALELRPRGITVNAVAPGPTDTDMFRAWGADESAKKFLLSRVPLGRIGLPADIADAVAFLASPDARWITGQVIDTAGGFLP
jgi:3-oxoacyl-[acyl-carrier protein] reductase